MVWKTISGTKLLNALEAGREKQALSCAAGILRRGGLVAFPTETVYGLGADALNPGAVGKIFQAKGRPPDNPLIVHLAGPEEVKRVVSGAPPSFEILARRFWPGPLTLVLPKKKVVPYITTAGLSSVAVRVPAHPLALELIKAAGVPVAAPSANLSGRPSPTRAAHVLDDMAGKIDAVLDGGPCPLGLESTVLSLLSEPPVLLRPGGVTLEALRAELKAEVLDATAEGKGPAGTGDAIDAPLSPGMKYRHYATRSPLLLVEGKEEYQRQQIAALGESFLGQGKKLGLLISREMYETLPPALLEDAGTCIVVLGSRAEPERLAERLFGALRGLDAQGVEAIVAEGFDDREIGKAIMNRLRKAASGILRWDAEG